MSLKQHQNKHLRTKSNKKSGRAGPRANRRSRFQHGKGKNAFRSKNSGKKGRK
jgi:hypothetical protein